MCMYCNCIIDRVGNINSNTHSNHPEYLTVYFCLIVILFFADRLYDLQNLKLKNVFLCLC